MTHHECPHVVAARTEAALRETIKAKNKALGLCVWHLRNVANWKLTTEQAERNKGTLDQVIKAMEAEAAS